MAKCICPDCKLYFSKLLNLFVQTASFYLSPSLCSTNPPSPEKQIYGKYIANCICPICIIQLYCELYLYKLQNIFSQTATEKTFASPTYHRQHSQYLANILQAVFVQFANCTCPICKLCLSKWQVYFSKKQNIFFLLCPTNPPPPAEPIYGKYSPNCIYSNCKMFLSKSANCICPNCKMYLFKLPASICHPVTHLRQQSKYWQGDPATGRPKPKQSILSKHFYPLQHNQVLAQNHQTYQPTNPISLSGH